MNKRIATQFLVLTFIIMLVSWGTCFVCGQFGITLENNFLLNIPYMFGGISPTIASYIVLKRNGQVSNFKEWIKKVFEFKAPVWKYLFVILMWIIYFMPGLMISGFKTLSPIYMIIVLLPVMVVGGGLEEAGWRYILQPELDKKFGFIISSLIVGVIWSLWHLPLFFIPEVGQYGGNFVLFAFGVLGLTFALGAIRKITDNVFLCVLFHSLANAASGVFVIEQSWLVYAVTVAIYLAVSILAVYIHSKKQKKTIATNAEY